MEPKLLQCQVLCPFQPDQEQQKIPLKQIIPFHEQPTVYPQELTLLEPKKGFISHPTTSLVQNGNFVTYQTIPSAQKSVLCQHQVLPVCRKMRILKQPVTLLYNPTQHRQYLPTVIPTHQNQYLYHLHPYPQRIKAVPSHPKTFLISHPPPNCQQQLAPQLSGPAPQGTSSVLREDPDEEELLRLQYERMSSRPPRRISTNLPPQRQQTEEPQIEQGQSEKCEAKPQLSLRSLSHLMQQSVKSIIQPQQSTRSEKDYQRDLHSPQHQTITRPVNPAMMTSEIPELRVCPICGKESITDVQFRVGNCSYVAALIMCMYLLCFLMWLPCVLPTCKDAYHMCPKCGALVGVYRRLQ